MTFPQGLTKWSPTPQRVGQHLIAIEVSHEILGITCQEFSLSVFSANEVSVALDAEVNTDEDKSVRIELRVNDVNQDNLSYLLVSQPSSGILIGSGSVYTSTPSANFFVSGLKQTLQG